jgi:hypothetical protein
MQEIAVLKPNSKGTSHNSYHGTQQFEQLRSGSVRAAFRSRKSSKGTERWRIDVKKLSIIGSDYHSEENVVGFYNTGARMMHWSKMGAFLARTPGPALRIGVLPDSRFRSHHRGWASCHLDYRRFVPPAHGHAGAIMLKSSDESPLSFQRIFSNQRRSCGGRSERVGSWAVQFGHSEGQHFEV